MVRIIIIMKFMITLVQVAGDHGNYKRCKWSNENCMSDSECCSEECYLAHEGTDPRCARGAVGFPCYADYQCESGLECSSTYKCCAPYWAVCSHINQCCNKKHVCREEQGFPYRRCLYPSQASRGIESKYLLLLTSMLSLILFKVNTQYIS